MRSCAKPPCRVLGMRHYDVQLVGLPGLATPLHAAYSTMRLDWYAHGDANTLAAVCAQAQKGKIKFGRDQNATEFLHVKGVHLHVERRDSIDELRKG